MPIAIDTRGRRVRAAAAARALIAGAIGWEQFVVEFGDGDDPAITELVELIEREPEVGGFWGVTPAQYRRYRARIDALIAALEDEPTR